jgi:glycosyltransferase involved in cell wall biosynthesis
MSELWLSVIMPTYNGEKYIAFALESIAKQQELEIECIVIDDGSSDSTLTIINSYQTKIPLKLIPKAREGNWVVNTNHALKIARADYVCFLHQDDIWLPNRLKIMKNLVFNHPDVNLFLHPSQFIDINNHVLGKWQCPLASYPKVIATNTILEKLLIQNFISIPAPIFKRDTALKVGGLNEKLWYTADWDFWLKIAAYGNTIYYPQCLSAFRVHSNSQTITRSSNLDNFREQLELVLNQYLPKLEFSPKRKKNLLKVANFSIEVNTSLAGIAHKQPVNLWRITLFLFSLGFSGCFEYFYNSRILERVTVRLKAKLSG